MTANWLVDPPDWIVSPLGTAGSLLILALSPVVSILDYASGTNLNFVMFYLVPTTLLAWRSGRRWAVAAAVVSGTGRLAADLAAHWGTPEASYVPAWNASAIALLMLSVAWVLPRLHEAIRAERGLARKDGLTGVANSRHFHELVEAELLRMRRSGKPMTIAYLDLDDFKAVNDSGGHAEGDRLLREVADAISESVRATDSTARLGGDEFALLLPETDQVGAERVVDLVYSRLESLRAENAWPVGISLGAATFLTAPGSVDEIVNKADELMYEAKEAGKGRAAYRVFD